MFKMIAVLCAAFCGTGKSYLCNNFADTYIEFECWKYQNERFPDNYIKDIISMVSNIPYILISTNPIALRRLNDIGYEINLYYPKNELKNEYFKRYVERGSNRDFLTTLNKYWDKWIDELKEQNYCKHIVLEDGQYLQDVLLEGNYLESASDTIPVEAIEFVK